MRTLITGFSVAWIENLYNRIGSPFNYLTYDGRLLAGDEKQIRLSRAQGLALYHNV